MSTTVRSHRPAARPRPRHARLGVALVVVVALALGVSGWEWRHPTAFPDRPTDHEGQFFPGVRSTQIMNVQMSSEADLAPRTVTINGIEPVILTNTANARIVFWLCTEKPGRAFISAIGNPQRHCRDLRPVEDQTVTLYRRPGPQITMTVVPTRPGVVRVRGMRVSYSEGWRSGTQTTGGHVLLHVR